MEQNGIGNGVSASPPRSTALPRPNAPASAAGQTPSIADAPAHEPQFDKLASAMAVKRIPHPKEFVERVHESEMTMGARNGYYMACVDLLPHISALTAVLDEALFDLGAVGGIMPNTRERMQAALSKTRGIPCVSGRSGREAGSSEGEPTAAQHATRSAAEGDAQKG